MDRFEQTSHSQSKMSKLIDKVRQTNKAARSLAEKPVGVFVGGTSGIGLFTAYTFARNTPEPTIYIIGRNADAAKKAIEDITKINSKAKSYFLHHELTLLSEADELVKEIKAKESKINLLCMTCGYLSFSGRDETSEGIDKKFAVNYHTRWRIIEQLMPLVVSANKLQEPSRVVNVLAAGGEGPLNMEDLELKNTYSLSHVNRHMVTMASLATKRFADLYPQIGFTHCFPGYINTGIMRQLPWIARAICYLPSHLFFEAPEAVGERTFYEGYSGPEFASGAHLVDQKMAPTKDKSSYLTKDIQEKVWEHTQEVYRRVRGDSA